MRLRDVAGEVHGSEYIGFCSRTQHARRQLSPSGLPDARATKMSDNAALRRLNAEIKSLQSIFAAGNLRARHGNARGCRIPAESGQEPEN
ncbi:MAG: hypothetical protein HY846_00400 [Nitrosomonadales bacterium]|nr:hypothetical protein [Nitrosomonadales bacterium]